MNRRKILSTVCIFLLSLGLTISCAQAPDSSNSSETVGTAEEKPIVIGYSNWAGWWPWAIAEQEGIFTKNNVNVEMKWFDGYLDSMEAFAAGKLDGNFQTLNDTIYFAADAI
ncbi:MAG: aliphatic sulfonates ABC transporter substrate-binding protein, partial [Cyanobacteria bacterium J06607_15]